MEILEQRTVLSAVPTVVDLQVSSTEWSSAFVGYLNNHSLGDMGYRVPVGSAAQSSPLPWNNLDQVVIKFSKDVDIRASHLAITSADAPTVPIVDFFYDAFTHVATWTLAQPLSANNYQIDLDGDGIDPVADLNGNALDGEWGNNFYTYASGDGLAGGDFEFFINVLPGDVAQDGLVAVADALASYGHVGQSTSSSGYLPLLDVNGNGAHDLPDVYAIIALLGDVDLEGLPLGMFSDAPSASQIDTVVINDHVNDVLVPLFDAFADAEDEDAELDFDVTSVSNPDLFDFVGVDVETGEMVLNAAWGASGRSAITVSATDPDGVVTQTTFYVDVDYENLPPQVIAWADPEENDTWMIRGYVTDADDDVRGMIVAFTGVFNLRATVQSDGTFSFAVYVDPADWGTEYAYVVDPHGLDDVHEFLIFPT